MEISSSLSSTVVMACRLPATPFAVPRSSLAFSGSAVFTTGLPPRSLGLASRRRRSGGAGPAARRFGCRCLFGLGVPELAVIAGVAALIFGPKKLPEIGRSIGKTVKSFQQAAKEFETELKKEPEAASEPPPPSESLKAVGSQEGEKTELEASGTKEST